MVKVSIILPTFRMGGLDLTKYSLLGQSFKSFELILVDELYSQRKDKVKEYFKGINLKHIPPFRVNNYFSSATSRNTGILCAEGELLVFTNDYTWLSPDCIERHWNAYSDLKGKYAITGIHTIMDGLKPVNPNLLYSFGTEVKSKPGGKITFVDDRAQFRGEKLLEYYEINPSVVYADNTSILLGAALELNGFDTHFDGGVGFLDVNFFTRASLLGYKVLMDANNVVHEVRSYHMAKEGNFKTLEDNQKYHRQNIDAIVEGNKALEADNSYSLRSLREIFNLMAREGRGKD